MTTRDDVRRTSAELRGEARGDTVPADALDDTRADARRGGERGGGAAGPALPERLYAARERKGVDLYRAERDTKIRARYLAALERGDYKELPGAVYTKGFLRNYALYLGLDPEDVLRQWKRERGDGGVATEPVLAVPRPLQAPRQGLTFSPGIIVAALVTVLIVLFAGYIGVQLLRFAKPPTIAVTDPATAVVEVDESTTSYVLRGESIPGAIVRITTPGVDQPYQATADGAGRWTKEVELRRGRNQFDITAVDIETGKEAENPQRVFITVPFLVIEAPTLTLSSPADGAKFENGAIPIQGTTTNAVSVEVAAQWVGPADGQPAGSPAASPAAGPTVRPVTVEVAEDGSFQTPLELSTGRWTITVTASSEEGKTAALSRSVAIEFEGVNLVVQIKGSRAWLKVWVDGKLDTNIGAAGKVYAPGKTLTFTGRKSVEVRTGSSGHTYFTLNGTSLGALGRKGIPETWKFAPPAEPERTDRR